MEEIIGVIFNNWTALKMSIEHGMGGDNVSVAEKVSGMIQTVMDSLKCSKFSWENISDNLDDMMDTQFNTLLEDNSSDEVAQIICEIYLMWKSDDQDALRARMNQFSVKTPLQNEFRVAPRPSARQETVYESDTVGNSFKVEDTSCDDGWTEVRHRR